MDPKISVVVPVYNTGEVLRDTLDSILSQTFEDFELILVDDGSKDDSGRVCDEYALKDNRVVVYHKQNGGICDARNYGLSKCSGKYVAFCDHDDLFKPNLLAKAYETAENTNADVTKFLYREISNSKTTQLTKLSSDVTVIDSLCNSLYELNSLGYFVTIWSFFYKKDWLISTNIKFDVSQKHGGEDFDFNVRIVPYIKKLAIIPEVLYLHFIRENLSTSAKMYDDVMMHFLKTQELLNSVAMKIGCNPNAHQVAFIKYYGECVINFISAALKLKKERQFIKYNLESFSKSNAQLFSANYRSLCTVILRYPKNAFAYLLTKLHLNSLSIMIFKMLKN